MKTKEIKIDSKFFEFDTFKVEKHVEKTQRYTYTVPSYIVDKDEEWYGQYQEDWKNANEERQIYETYC